MPLQIKRGPTADRTGYTPLVGELVFDTDQNVLYVGDGATTGGIASTSITLEDAQDTAASLLTSGSHSGITFTYNDAANRIDATVTPVVDGFLDADIKGSVFGDDSSIIIDAVDNRIYANGGSIYGQFNVISDVNPLTDTANFASYTTTGVNTVGLSRARGTSVVPAIVQDTDLIYNFAFRGWDGDNFQDSSRIIAQVNGAVSNGVVPGSLVLQTANSSGSLTTAISIDSTQKTSFFQGGVDVYNNDLNLLIWSGVANSRAVHFQRYRGSISAETIVQVNDYLGQVKWAGYDGAAMKDSAQIRAEVDTTPALNIVPGRLRMLVANASGTLTTAVTISSTLKTTFSGETEHLNTEITSLAYRTTTAGRSITFKRHRGTSSVPAIVNTGDYTGQIKFQGYDGSAAQDSAQIRSEVVGTPALGVVAGNLRFLTANSAGALTTALTINESQSVTIAGNLTVNGTIFGGAFNGSIFADNSTMIIDGATGNIPGYVSIATLKTLASASATYLDFQNAIAAL
jgi:hypothetical protein